ncbi:MAG: hypothetical protein ABFS35_03905 [Bacteroidota bacterium]
MDQINIVPNHINKQTNNTDNLTLEITDCEKSTIKYIGDGATISQIAEKLLLSPDKINEIIEKLLIKTNTRNLAHLMMYVAVNKVLH